ncbi:MAG: hypothetical protein WCI63_01410 [bacterium]
MKVFKWILLIVTIIIIALIGYGIFAFTQIKSNKQKDLGVKYTIADYNQAVKEKAKVDVPIPGALYLGSTFKTEGSQQVDLTLSDAEVSAIQNYSNNLKGPINNVQIKFLGGKKAEASFVTNFTYQGRKINYPIYVKGDVYNTGAKSFGVKVDKLQAGALSVPGVITKRAESEFTSYVNNILSGINGLDVQKVEINNGSVHFVGTIPTKASGL